MIFYDWQLRAFDRIRGRSAVLSSPTGTGKTLVAYLWAGILREDGQVVVPGERIIFTAPIKALSNERYLDLRRMGLDVGIETGDFKRNEGAPIVCCTQEIYTLKYCRLPGQRLVVDEFHYVFSDPDRARAYIDGLRDTHPDTPVLVMSATFGGADTIGAYLSDVSERPFIVCENFERVTELIFRPKPPATINGIRDALVFVFSQKGAAELAYRIARTRRRISPEKRKRLYELADILDVPKVQMPLLCGVGVYHGGMLPKEKLLVEAAFRERILDVVAGTDALSLGVNLPAETAVFAQLVHYHDDAPISKIEFLQMSGRAGRKGLFDTGYVTWLADSPFEHKAFKTDLVFRELMEAEPEGACVTLRPAFGRLLRKQVTLKDEVRYICDYSLPKQDPALVEGLLRDGLKKIDRALRKLVPVKARDRFRKIMANIWYEEMDVDENLAIAVLFFHDDTPGALEAARLAAPFERNYLQALLKIKRFANRLPKGYRFRGMRELNNAVDSIDPTIFGFEEKIGEIEHTLSLAGTGRWSVVSSLPEVVVGADDVPPVPGVQVDETGAL